MPDGHAGRISALEFGSFSILATGDYKGKLCFWDIETGKIIHELDLNSDNDEDNLIREIVAVPNQREFIIDDNGLLDYRFTSNRIINGDYGFSPVLSKSGKYLAIRYHDYPDSIKQLVQEDPFLFEMDYPNGRGAPLEGFVRIIQLDSLLEMQLYTININHIMDYMFSDSELELITLSNDGNKSLISIWNLKGDLLWSKESEFDFINIFPFKNNKICFQDRSGSIYDFDLISRQLNLYHKGSNSGLYSVSRSKRFGFSNDRRKLIVFEISKPDSIVFDLDNEIENYNQIHFDFNDETNHLAIAYETQIRLYDLTSRSVERLIVPDTKNVNVSVHNDQVIIDSYFINNYSSQIEGQIDSFKSISGWAASSTAGMNTIERDSSVIYSNNDLQLVAISPSGNSILYGVDDSLIFFVQDSLRFSFAGDKYEDIKTGYTFNNYKDIIIKDSAIFMSTYAKAPVINWLDFAGNVVKQFTSPTFYSYMDILDYEGIEKSSFGLQYSFSRSFFTNLFVTDKYIFANRDGLHIWDRRDGKELNTLKSSILALDESNDIFVTSRLYSRVTKNFILEIFYLGEPSTPVHILKGHQSPVNTAFIFDKGTKLVSQEQRGDIIIWDIRSGKELLRIRNYSNSGCIAYTPNGLYDGNLMGIDNAYFLKDLEVINISQLKDRFYEPDLLPKIFGYSKDPLRNTSGLELIELYPSIKLTNVSSDNHVVVNLKNRGGGIGKVKILINGKEVASDARAASFDPDSKQATINFSIEDHPYLIPGQENTITVQAYNKEGYLVSRGASITYTPDEKQVDPPNLYGIVVGSSNYRGESLDLKYAAKDANDFASALKLVGDKYFGNDKVFVKTLTTDNKDFTYWPTKENIERTFKEVSTTAGPEDVIVVYMSGHGTNYGGAEGDFYFLTSDANNADLKDPAIRKSVAISSDEWTEYIKWVPALKQVMVIDACHSGQLADDIMAARADKSSAEIRALERMKDRTGMYILSGSAADAVSYETSVYGQGLLTYSLLQGMKGAALRDEKFVDIMQLFEHSANTVPQLAKNIGGIQKPEVRVPYGGGSFDIGIVDVEVQNAINLPSPKPIFLRSSFQNEDTFNDDLNLSEQLDSSLRDLNAKDGNEQAIIFVDARKYSDAYSLKGRYQKLGEDYKVDVRIFKGEEIVNKFEIQSIQEGLKNQIIDKVLEIIK